MLYESLHCQNYHQGVHTCYDISKAEGTLNLFCTRAHLQGVCIIPSVYRIGGSVIIVLPCLVNAPFTCSGSRYCHGLLAIFRTDMAGRSAVGISNFRII
jgi:hypothetical protein